MTLWGEPEWMHVQNMEQLHAHGCYQNVTDLSVTQPQHIISRHQSTHIATVTVSQASGRSLAGRSHTAYKYVYVCCTLARLI